jgi:ABC-2 type transport system ATP-binding protein
VRRLDDAGVGIDDIALRRPTLDDVFIALTGHAAEEEPATRPPRRWRHDVEETAAIARRTARGVDRRSASADASRRPSATRSCSRAAI